MRAGSRRQVAGTVADALRPVEIELDHRPLWQVARALIGREPGVAFLDGGGASAQARWSVLGWRPRRVVVWPQGRTGALEGLRELFDHGSVAREDDHRTAGDAGDHRPPVRAGDPRPPVREGDRGPTPDGDDRLPFHGGWMGWFSYDLGRHLERLPHHALADDSIPDFAFGQYDVVLLEDRAAGRLYAAGWCGGHDDERRLCERAAEALRLAELPSPDLPTDVHEEETARASPAHSRPKATRTPGEPPAPRPRDRAAPSARSAPGLPRPLIDRTDYIRAVEQVLHYIRAGSIYQANFSHRFSATTSAPSRDIYARLRAATPAPFGCYIDLPDAPEILSASPELFVRKTGRLLQTRPIKGTRPRGGDATEDARLLAELEASAKERAELLMITDLLRNDLGRVAQYGSVAVTRLRELESHPTVHHAYSVIEARMRDDAGIADLIAAIMPGGSVTGAPKIRAMQILDELEPLRRGPYTGAAGFIGYDGEMCLNILIRTLVRQGREIWYQVGGGIVADSDPAAEYDETLAKGAALRRALEVGHRAGE